MKCLDIERFLDAYLDSEFDERERLEFELHIENCPACAEHLEFEQRLRQDIREALHAPAPDALRGRIAAALDDAPATPTHSTWTQWRGWRYVSLAAAACALIGLGLAGITSQPQKLSSSITAGLGTAALSDAQAAHQEEDELVRESVAWHRKKLPMEVTGPRTETVDTWFRDKVDFPVRLPRFRNPNVALLGGRLAHVQNRKAALLTLEVNHRKLSMMVVPTVSQQQRPPHFAQHAAPRVTLRTARGYNIAIIQDGDITYTYTSDIPPRDLSLIVNTSFGRK